MRRGLGDKRVISLMKQLKDFLKHLEHMQSMEGNENRC